jgi:hypothetical protein
MPQLQILTFDIITYTSVNVNVNNQLYEDIRCTLTICNGTPRRYKPSHDTNNNNQVSSVTVFPYLTHLEIYSGNIDNLEQLFIDTRTLLPRLIHLTIPYSYIEEITENFTREATRRNCINIQHFNFHWSLLVHCEDFYRYFPCYK